MNRFLHGVILPLFVLASAIPASAAGLVYTCDPNINTTVAGLCARIQSILQPLYNNTFSSIANGNFAIYIQFGNTGLGQSSTGFDNQVTYSSYLAALTTASASGNPIQTAAVSALNSYDTSAYGTRMVDIPSALGTALGLPNMTGTNAALNTPCSTPGVAPCYNGVITVTNQTSSLYFRTGPAETASQYDFFGVVEHETDEVLGTSSCISTTGAMLADTCPASTGGANTPSAVDLFRYQSAGNLVLLSTTPGAYFSYNGGSKNGADGKLYNTVSNGNDYADFVSPTPCQVQQNIQDGVGCVGYDANIDITSDGGAEINILNAVGYKLTTTAASLSISATHSSPISQGGPGTLTLTVANSGGTTAGTATVSDTINSGFAINSTSNGNNASNGCSFSGQIVTCTIPAGSSFATMTFTVYVTASSTAASWTNSPMLSDTSGSEVAGATTNDSITVGAAAPQVDSSLTQTALSGSTDYGTCAGGFRTLTAIAMLGNTSGTTLNNPYAAGITLTNSNTLLWQLDPASIPSTNVLPFYFHIQLTNCSTFQLKFDVNSN